MRDLQLCILAPTKDTEINAATYGAQYHNHSFWSWLPLKYPHLWRSTLQLPMPELSLYTEAHFVILVKSAAAKLKIKRKCYCFFKLLVQCRTSFKATDISVKLSPSCIIPSDYPMSGVRLYVKYYNCTRHRAFLKAIRLKSTLTKTTRKQGQWYVFCLFFDLFCFCFCFCLFVCLFVCFFDGKYLTCMKPYTLKWEYIRNFKKAHQITSLGIRQ